jgi:hypothetical protein
MANTTKSAVNADTSANEISAIQLEQGRFMLEEIAMLANATVNSCESTHEHFVGESIPLEIEMYRLVRVIKHIGLLADVGASDLGGSAIHEGSPADWMLPSGYVGSGRGRAA